MEKIDCVREKDPPGLCDLKLMVALLIVFKPNAMIRALMGTSLKSILTA